MIFVTVVFHEVNGRGYEVHRYVKGDFELPPELKSFEELRLAVLTALRTVRKEISLATPLRPWRQALSTGPASLEFVLDEIRGGQQCTLDATSYETKEQSFGPAVHLRTDTEKLYNQYGRPVKQKGSACISLAVTPRVGEARGGLDSGPLVRLLDQNSEPLRRSFSSADVTDDVKQPLASALAALLCGGPRCLVGRVAEARGLDRLLSEKIPGRQPLLGPYVPKLITTLQEFLASARILPADWRELLSAVASPAELERACYQLGYYQVRLLIAELQAWNPRPGVLELTGKLHEILKTMTDHPDLDGHRVRARALRKIKATGVAESFVQRYLESPEHCAGCGGVK